MSLETAGNVPFSKWATDERPGCLVKRITIIPGVPVKTSMDVNRGSGLICKGSPRYTHQSWLIFINDRSTSKSA